MNLEVSGAAVAAGARFTSALVKTSTFPVLSLYCKSKGRGKAKMSALNAVRAKLINRVFATVHRGSEYVVIKQYKQAA